MKRAGISAWVMAAATASAAYAGDWPQFRGPSASGIGDGAKTPVKWDATKGTNIVWSVEIPGLADSSPIVWRDQIFVTTAVSSDPKQTFRTGLYGDTDSANDNSPHKWEVLAIDKKTGKILWQQTAHEGVPKTKRHPKENVYHEQATLRRRRGDPAELVLKGSDVAAVERGNRTGGQVRSR